MKAWIRNNDWLLWGALGCALVGTAHAEYTLATAAGVQSLVALAVPGALDLYVIRALRVGRDVFVAVLLMVLANVASHLVHSGDIPVTWVLRSAVGALAPFILWRVYSLKRTRTRKELLWGAEAGAVSAPEVQQAPSALDDPGAPEDWTLTYLPPGWVTEYEAGAPGAAPVAADQSAKSPSAPVPGSVPGLPPGFASALNEGDAEYLGALQAYLDTCEETGARVSVRGCKEFLKVGQERAKRLLAHAGYPAEVQQ